MTFSTFVTPARESDTWVAGADACTSGNRETGVRSIDCGGYGGPPTYVQRPVRRAALDSAPGRMAAGTASGWVKARGPGVITDSWRAKPRHRDVLDDAHAFWLRTPGRGEIRPVALPEPGRGDVVVRTLRSGVSRGTETLVFRGGVPPGQYAAMRAPFQEGDFPGPVKYGYLNVGAVEEGPPDLRGRTVFCLYPHQTAYVVPSDAVTVVPEGVPPGRAVLAGTVETAVNALWDAAPLLGDRVTVVGAGMVGCCVARLLSLFPEAQVTLVDVDAGRADIAAALGVDFALPDEAAGGCDLVVHTS